ncbi:MAG: MFS transporter [Clostridia bacterium]|nr:MFS transporter [Clostridia bacterium]
MAKFPKQQKALLSVHMLRIVLELFTSTFLVSYILAQNPDSILGKGLINIGIFYVSWNAVYGILNFVASYLVDRSDRAMLLRCGIIFNILLMVALVFWGEQISHWLVLAGAVCGMSDAFYYSSYIIMRNELSFKGSFKRYNVFTTIGVNLVKVIVPIIMGYIIDISTFSTIAIYVVVVGIAQFAITFFVKSTKSKDSKFELRKFFRYLKDDKFAWNKTKYTYINCWIAGIKSTYNVIVVILTIYIFKTNLSLGIYTSIFSLVTILILIAYRKADPNPKFNKFVIYLIVGLSPFLAIIATLIHTSTVTLVILNFTLTLVSYFSDYFGDMERDAIMKNLNQYEFIAEHQFVAETTKVTSRVISFSFFIVMGLIASFTAFKIFLLIILAASPIKFMIMYKQRLIRKELVEKNKELGIESSENVVF